MDTQAQDIAVRLLLEADRSRTPLERLPPDSVPATPEEALAIQDRIVAAAGRPVAGWKVATTPQGVSTYGTIYADDCFASPAVVPKERYPLMGIEGEVAFRFKTDIPATGELTDAQIRGLFEPFPAFEIVASRYVSYADTPTIARLADRMSNGGMVLGTAAGTQRDFSSLTVRLSKNADVVVDQVGGHSRGDPYLPAVEFVQAYRSRIPFRAGQFITAGTLTGLRYGNPGESWELDFEGFGQVALMVI